MAAGDYVLRAHGARCEGLVCSNESSSVQKQRPTTSGRLYAEKETVLHIMY
jgi:hypothetical protein